MGTLVTKVLSLGDLGLSPIFLCQLHPPPQPSSLPCIGQQGLLPISFSIAILFTWLTTHTVSLACEVTPHPILVLCGTSLMA